MIKYGKFLFVVLLVSGLLAISYGGCGGTTEDTGGGGNTAPTNPPPTNPPPTNPPDPGACEGDAFIGDGATSTRAIECLSDFLVQNAETSSLSCFCNASEAGDFILNISNTFLGTMSINFEFPATNPEIPITNIPFEWTTFGCTGIELFTIDIFGTSDPVSIGTLDNMTDTEPDELSFTANVSDPLLLSLFGSSGQNVSCDFCSIGGLPQCAPEL